jgi:hypothetical protein
VPCLLSGRCGLQPAADTVQRTEAPPLGVDERSFPYGLESAATGGGRPWAQPSSCLWSFSPLPETPRFTALVKDADEMAPIGPS